MSEETPQTAIPEQDPASLQILTQYMRDLSFENPNAPNSLSGGDEAPRINVSANVNVRQLGEREYEVGLQFRVETHSGDAVNFIVELVYCGLFRTINIPEESLRPVLLIEAPRQLFPFARRILADATRDGGFPPLLLDPINFVELYQKNMAQEQQQEQQNGAAAAPDPSQAN